MGRFRSRARPGRPQKPDKLSAAERKRLSRQRLKEQNSGSEEPQAGSSEDIVTLLPAKRVGRPSKPNKLSDKERKQLSRQKAEVREKENERKKDLIKEQQKTADGIEKLREKWKRQKQAQRLNQSRQKRNTIRQKDSARKRNERKKEPENVKQSTSAERMRKHRQSLKVKCDFLKRKTVGSEMRKSKERLKRTLEKKSREERVHFFRDMIISQSPGTKRDIQMTEASTSTSNSSSILSSPATPLVTAYKQLKDKRDKVSNTVKRALISSLGNTSKTKIRKLGASYATYKKIKGMRLEQMLMHIKTKMRTRPPKVTPEEKDRILNFYMEDNVSRVLPYKNRTILMKNKIGVKERVAMRVMELTLVKAYEKFSAANVDIQIDRRSFEKLRPRNVLLKRCAKRLVCACSYHINIDHLRGGLSKLLKRNEKEEEAKNLSSNEKMTEFLLCKKDIKCLTGNCENCKDFEKIKNLMSQNSFYCSDDCKKKNINCTEIKHKVTIKQFERISYEHKGKEKKKISLVDKTVTQNELVDVFMAKMRGFPRHRFNIEHTKSVYDDLVGYLTEDSILKVMDFSQNYTCLLVEEIMSIHWTQETVVVYPVVVLTKSNEDLREDHFVFFSEDKQKDPWFVEYCNNIIMDFYKEKGLAISKDIEITDGCGAQFKSIKAFKLFPERKIDSTRVFFETAHGKSKSDGLGGVVKSYCSSAVAAGDATIRNCDEVVKFCEQNVTVAERSLDEGVMQNRIFFNVTPDALLQFREANPVKDLHSIPGTLKIHQITNKVNCTKGIYHQEFSCCCQACMEGNHGSCKHATTPGVFSSDLSFIRPKWSIFKEKHSKRK